MSSNDTPGDSVISDGIESAEETLSGFVSERPLTALALAVVFGALLAHRVFRRRAPAEVEH